jgi:putative oxidoreductase
VNTVTSSLPLPQRAVRLYIGRGDLIDKLQPLFALALRLYIVRVFFVSGLTKTRSWDSTLAAVSLPTHRGPVWPGTMRPSPAID